MPVKTNQSKDQASRLIAGDELFVPAGGFLILPPGVEKPVAQFAPGLLKFKLGPGGPASPAPAEDAAATPVG